MATDTHMQTKSGKITIVALVENKPGVLNRVVSLFRRRAFNVDSLTVGRTHKPHVSRMTIVVDSERMSPFKIKANLEKLVNVIDVQVLNRAPHVSRDLVLIKVRTDGAERSNGVTTVCEHYPAKIIDMGPEFAIIEMSGTEEFVEQFIDELREFDIVELVRTGVVAMGRGTRIQDTEYQPIINGNNVHKNVV
ncbi:MAG: acetolactate synthase small subunit [Anaerolineae bacterium]|nr:acetolactate synthase small subunit [Anaerolineae bacterium]MDQ7035485.1 acetolactate synthase small subunit [Anaerolineae bacterium]